LERQFVQFETAAADGQLARAVVGVAADLQVFHPDVALVGELDVQQRGLVIAFKAGPSGGVGSFPAQAFPIQGDARQFLIIKRGHGQVQTASAADIKTVDGVAAVAGDSVITMRQFEQAVAQARRLPAAQRPPENEVSEGS